MRRIFFSFRSCSAQKKNIGFPSETEEDFQKSLNFVEDLNCIYTIFFGYSERPNTESSRIEPKIHPKVIEERISRLIKLQKKLESQTKVLLN